MSWSVLCWILDFPLKEASGDSEDRVQEENPDDTYWLDENDNGSCCGSNTRCSGSDDDVAEPWFFSNEVLEHKGVNNEISLKETGPVDVELRQQTLRDDAKKFWEACIAHGY